jgi:hypothetical protein
VRAGGDVVSDQRCECCDLLIESCGKAAEQRQRAQDKAQKEILRRIGFFPALYDGTCEYCGYWFKRGSLIRKGDFGWRGECCA